MTAFALVAVVMLAIACACVLVPLLRRNPATERNDASNLSVLRDQRRELEADRANGVLSPEQFEAARTELEQRVLEETRETAAPAASTRASAWAATLIAAGMPTAAVVLYLTLGTPTALLPGASPPAGTAQRVTPQDIDAMIERVKERLAARPDDLEGWRILARTYLALGRIPEALPAYERAARLAPDDADLLADYADALAASQNRSLAGPPEALIERALRANPEQWKANALAGSLAFERGQFSKAVDYWERVKRSLPADSPILATIDASLAEARTRAGSSTPATPSPSLADARPRDGNAAPSAGASIAGTVTLSPSIATGASPDDTVFVFARPADGTRMPVALVRARVRDLPLAFTLDDTTSMVAERKLSTQTDVVLGARVSRSGNAMPQPGDLEATLQPAKIGARGIRLVIDRKLP